MLPKDPNILLSVVNTKLRDEFSSLEDLCAALDEDQEAVCRALAALSYRYDREQNRFIAG